MKEVGTTANAENTTLNVRTASGNYAFKFANDEFRGNILTMEEYELVRQREQVVSTQAKAEALSNMTDLIRAQADVATEKAASAAAQSNADTARYILERRDKAAKSAPTITAAGGI